MNFPTTAILALLLLPGCSKSPGPKRQAGDRPTSFFGRPLATDEEKPNSYLLFPTALSIELKNGAWAIGQTDRLATFLPG